MDSKKILIVEGATDKRLFTRICNKNLAFKSIEVRMPNETEGDKYPGGKQGVIKFIEDTITEVENTLTIAAIVDADYSLAGDGGVEKTLKIIQEKILPYGYNGEPNACSGGYIFNNKDKEIKPFGLWIMTAKNNNEGVLEDWIKESVNSDNLQAAIDVVDAIKNPKFSDNNKSKAQVATWLAWQKKPDQGFASIFSDNLINEQSESFLQLVAWLKAVFDDKVEEISNG